MVGSTSELILYSEVVYVNKCRAEICWQIVKDCVNCSHNTKFASHSIPHVLYNYIISTILVVNFKGLNFCALGS